MGKSVNEEEVATFFEFCFDLLFPIVIVLGVFFLIKSLIRWTTYYTGNEKLDGKTILITGGSSGLGLSIATECARRGARVLSACRTRLRRESTAFYLREKTGSLNIRVMYMDLNNLESVREFAKEVIRSENRLDVIVNNAGVLSDRDFTADGIDLMMGINYVGHFLLTCLLLDKLRTTPGTLGRVIHVTCGSFTSGQLCDLMDMEDKQKKGDYDIRRMYRSSKLGLFLFNTELARRYRVFEIASLCVDPGPMNTAFYKNLPSPYNRLWTILAKIMFRTPEEGMQSVMHAILAKKLESESGNVIKDCKSYEPSNSAWTIDATCDLWERTEELIRSKGINFCLDEGGEPSEEEEDLGGGVQIDLSQLAHLTRKDRTPPPQESDEEQNDEQEEEISPQHPTTAMQSSLPKSLVVTSQNEANEEDEEYSDDDDADTIMMQNAIKPNVVRISPQLGGGKNLEDDDDDEEQDEDEEESPMITRKKYAVRRPPSPPKPKSKPDNDDEEEEEEDDE